MSEISSFEEKTIFFQQSLFLSLNYKYFYFKKLSYRVQNVFSILQNFFLKRNFFMIISYIVNTIIYVINNDTNVILIIMVINNYIIISILFNLKYFKLYQFILIINLTVMDIINLKIIITFIISYLLI